MNKLTSKCNGCPSRRPYWEHIDGTKKYQCIEIVCKRQRKDNNSFYCIYSNEHGNCEYDNDIPFCMSDFCCVYFNDCDYCIYKDNCSRNRHGYWIKCIDEEERNW